MVWWEYYQRVKSTSKPISFLYVQQQDGSILFQKELANSWLFRLLTTCRGEKEGEKRKEMVYDLTMYNRTGESWSLKILVKPIM